MATYSIPSNAGRFTVVVGRGGHYCVWNSKQGKGEVSIPIKNRKQAEEICRKLNRKEHNGSISVYQ